MCIRDSSPAAIALLFTIVMCLFIGSFHWILGVIALAAYLIVGIVIPIVISRCSGDDGLRFRTRSGELSGFVLDSLRGLSEILQYGQGKKRLSKMNEKTDELSRDEEKMKRTAGRNTAVTNTAVSYTHLDVYKRQIQSCSKKEDTACHI